MPGDKKPTKEQIAKEILHVLAEWGASLDEQIKCLGIVRNGLIRTTAAPQEKWRASRGGPMDKPGKKQEK